MRVDVVDGLARGLSAVATRPEARDALAVAGVALMVLAVALWKPLLGIFLLGAILVAGAFVLALLRAPEKEGSDGHG